MFSIWKYLWKFTPHAQGFHSFGDETVKRVTRKCLRWERYVMKYTVKVAQGEEGPIKIRIPAEYGLRCAELEPVIVNVPKGGTRRVEYRDPVKDFYPFPEEYWKRKYEVEPASIYQAKKPKSAFVRERSYPPIQYASKQKKKLGLFRRK